jgi:serine/threonine protein kinase
LAESDGRVITSVIVHFMKKLSGGVLDKLWEGGGFVLSRATLPDEPTPVLVLAPASERPKAGVIARLEHAFALREELDPSGVARPLRLVQYRGLPALLLEDPGGNLLANLLGEPWDLPRFLRVAIEIAVALSRLHARGLIHRDLNPANILVNPVTGQAWLIDLVRVGAATGANRGAAP